MFVIKLCEIKFVNIEIKVLKKVRNKVFYIVKMKSKVLRKVNKEMERGGRT